MLHPSCHLTLKQPRADFTIFQPRCATSTKLGLKSQTVNDLLTMFVVSTPCAFGPEAEAKSFDTEVVACWSQLAGSDATSPLFHLPHRMGV